MDENTLTVLKLAAKQTANQIKDEILSTKPGLVMTFALVGVIDTLFTGFILTFVIWFLLYGYFNYQHIQDQMLFDQHADEYDRKQAQREANAETDQPEQPAEETVEPGKDTQG